jgi:hypothetical protein
VSPSPNCRPEPGVHDTLTGGWPFCAVGTVNVIVGSCPWLAGAWMSAGQLSVGGGSGDGPGPGLSDPPQDEAVSIATSATALPSVGIRHPPMRRTKLLAADPAAVRPADPAGDPRRRREAF